MRIEGLGKAYTPNVGKNSAKFQESSTYSKEELALCERIIILIGHVLDGRVVTQITEMCYQ